MFGQHMMDPSHPSSVSVMQRDASDRTVASSVHSALGHQSIPKHAPHSQAQPAVSTTIQSNTRKRKAQAASSEPSTSDRQKRRKKNATNQDQDGTYRPLSINPNS
jgi:hypothetical protein